MQEICDDPALTASGYGCMISGMRLPSVLAWLIDEASAVPGPDHFMTTLGAQLMSDGLPLAGGALTLAAPHPIIARRTWLWRAETGAVIEALSFASMGQTGPGGGAEQGKVGGGWLAGVGAGLGQGEASGTAAAGGS